MRDGTAANCDWANCIIWSIYRCDWANYNNYDQRLDVENAKTFKKYEFLKACDAMGVTKDMKSNA